MIKRSDFYQLLTDVLGAIPVHPDYVPATAELPAVSYLHITSQLGERPIDGGLDLRGDSWQVEVLASTRDEVDQIIGKIEALDNTQASGFQRIVVLSQRDDPAAPDINYRRSFIDLSTTNRSANS